MSKKQQTSLLLPLLQQQRFLTPNENIIEDLTEIYQKCNFSIGWPKKEKRIFDHLARPHTVAIVGVALGDEGKGRLVDNKIGSLLENKKIKRVNVVRFQGGNNAGHTVEKDDVKLALHLIPSSVMHEKAIGIMDRGMVINIEDLQTEVVYVEDAVGTLTNRLFLSDDGILCTDLERAEESLNCLKVDAAKGGTGRGIGPSYAHHYDRLGLTVSDILSDDWIEKLGNQYDRYAKEFAAFDSALKDVSVPDFRQTVEKKIASKRTVGNKKQFLDRLATARSWLLKRKFITNTNNLHREIYHDLSQAVLFEGAQAAGLDAWVGTRPDVTASNTTIYGVRDGTGFWRLTDIQQRIGVFKITYTSSVGARRMPTHVSLPKDLSDLPKNASEDERWAAYVREEAHEYGTTTGRPRDITFLDLAFLSYNARMAGVEMLIGTHLDIARVDEHVKICTHYEAGVAQKPYQPGLRYQRDVAPQFAALPGWDGKACQKAKKEEELPIEAQQYLSFIEKRLGYPIVAVTTGSDRKNFIAFDGYTL